LKNKKLFSNGKEPAAKIAGGWGEEKPVTSVGGWGDDEPTAPAENPSWGTESNSNAANASSN
jgi:hypothetical protein